MQRIVEMGSRRPAAACGDYGCGTVSVEDHDGVVKCRDEATGAFTPCGIGSVGEFVTKGKKMRKGRGKILTPHPRWGTGQQFWNVTPKGAAHLRSLFPGRTRMVSPFHGGDADVFKTLKRVAGIGNFGMTDVRSAFKFHPQTVEPGKVIMGNVVGSFIPAIVDKVMERTSVTERTKGIVRFSTGAAGLAGVLFMRKNSYVLGASLALLPGFVDSVSTWLVSLVMRGRSASLPSVAPAAEPEVVNVEGIGQMTNAERKALNQATFKAFGRGIKGTRMGQLQARGFENIVPDDGLDLANSSRMVAGIGAPIGGNGYRPIGL